MRRSRRDGKVHHPPQKKQYLVVGVADPENLMKVLAFDPETSKIWYLEPLGKVSAPAEVFLHEDNIQLSKASFS